MVKSIMLMALAVVLTATPALAESPYPRPKNGRETIVRDGGKPCPTGYVGLGSKCEALHQDTPRAYPKIQGAPCPAGTFSSNGFCKELH